MVNDEATDAAVDRRKFLLKRIFQPQPVPKNEEEEEEEEEGVEEDDEEDKQSWPWDCAVNRVGQMKMYCNEREESDCHVHSSRLPLLQLLSWEMFIFALPEATLSCSCRCSYRGLTERGMGSTKTGGVIPPLVLVSV